VAAAAGVGAGLAGCHPTGYAGVDLIYTALIGAGFAIAAGTAPRGVLLVVTAVAVPLSRSWLIVPAGAALLAAFAAVLPRRRVRPLSELSGALAVQVVLRWPPLGFHGLTAAVAAACILSVALAAWTAMSRPGRRRAVVAAAAAAGLVIVCSVPALIGAYLARPTVDRAVSRAKAALTDIESGQAPAAVDTLDTAAAEFGRAHARADAWWTWGAALVPVVAQQHRSVAQLTSAGTALAADGGRQAALIDFHRIRARNGQVDLAALERLTGPLQDLHDRVETTLATADHQSQWLLPQVTGPLHRLRDQLAKADGNIGLALEATRQVPALLGADGERRYLAVFMTPAETRGLGGFLGAYAEISVDQGRLRVVRTGLPKDMSDPHGEPAIPGPADYLARYGPFDPGRHFEDVSYSPDFPSVAEVLEALYPQVGGDHIDGVLLLDPDALATLLGFTGPISVPGFPDTIDSANAADVLLRQQYLLATAGGQSGRHDLLQQALAIGFKRLTSSTLPSPKVLGQALGPVIRQGRLLFWTADPRPQRLLRRLGLAGSFPAVPAPPADLFALTIANAANNKIDAYLSESVQQNLVYDPATGTLHDDVQVDLHNGAAASLPDYVIGSFVGSGLPPATNFGWLSVYSPYTLSSATLGGAPFRFQPPVTELGVHAYSAFVTIPSLTDARLELHFVGSPGAGTSLSAAVRLQPLARPVTERIVVTPAPGWALQRGADPVWTPGPDEVQIHTWRFRKIGKIGQNTEKGV